MRRLSGTCVSDRAAKVMREAMEEAVRRLDGCERFRLPDGIAEAAIADGRPYEEFLSALLAAGLEVWGNNSPAARKVAFRRWLLRSANR